MQQIATDCNTRWNKDRQHPMSFGDYRLQQTATDCNTPEEVKTDSISCHLATTILPLHRNILQHTATHCNARWSKDRQHPALFDDRLQHTLQHTSTYCNRLQQNARHCNTLQYAAICCNTLRHTSPSSATLQHTTRHCNTLQHTATHQMK